MDLSPSPLNWSHLYALTCFATFVLAFLLAAFVLWKNPKQPAGRMWAIMCLFVASWAGWNTVSLLSPTPEGSIKYLRIGDAFALFIPVTFLHFAMHFSGRMRLKTLKLSYLTTVLLATTVGTPWFIQAGQKKFGIWFEQGGPAFVGFAILFVLLPSYGLRLLWQEARASEGARKAQLFCLFFAFAPGFGGSFMWFLPALGIDIPPLGAHVVALYCVIVMYALVRYQFLDIQVVIRRSLVYSLLVTLLTIGYFGLVYGMERILQITLGYRSAWVSLAAFALMALTFQPLKVGIQRVVDRLIFRAPQEEIAKRLERLEEQALQTEKFKAVSTLAAGMAHEIKNPLTTLKTFTEYIPEKQGDPAFLQKLHEVYTTEINRIQAIVKDLLEFSKPRPPELKPIDIGPLIASTVNLLSGDLLRRRVQWTVDCRHNGSVLHADADQLRQVLINLIQNAADAMPAGGQLRIATQAVNSHLELTVSDTGHGIPLALLPKIFDPFVTTKPDGNGLGLAMVYSILQAHRGSIRVDSQPNRGTTFTVSLPL